MMNYKCSFPWEIQTFYMIYRTTLAYINSLSCISLILLGVLGFCRLRRPDEKRGHGENQV